MKEIHIAVQDRRAFQTNKTAYLCGDGDFVAVFSLDAEWEELPVRTARFQTENGCTDVIFQGDRCPVPVIPYAKKLEIGIYAGNVRTTTPASVALREGIRAAWGAPENPTPNVFDQVMDRLMDSAVELETTQEGVRLTVRYRGGTSTGFLRHSEVYVGAGDMPEGYRVQLDPTVQPPALRVRGLDGALIPLPGIQGEKGEKGDKGDPGPQGPKGDLGENVVRSVNDVFPEEDGSLRLTPGQLGALASSGGSMTGELSLGGYRLTQLAAPTASTDGVNKAYVDTIDVSTILTASGWSGTGPYTQTVTVDGLMEGKRVMVHPKFGSNVETNLAMKEACACVSFARRSGNNVTFTCLEDKPDVDMYVVLEVYV